MVNPETPVEKLGKGEWLFLGAVFLLALALRLGVFTQSLWFDEILTAKVSGVPIADVMRECIEHNSPHLPLYYWITHFFVAQLSSDWASRVPALLFGMLTLPLMYLLVRRVVDQKTRMVAFFLLAVSPMHVSNSQDAREYTLLLFAALLSILLLLRVLDRGKPIDWVLFFLAQVMLIFVSFFGFLAALSHSLFFVATLARDLHDRKRSIREAARLTGAYTLCGILTLAAFLPMIPVLREWLRADLVSSVDANLAVSPDWPFLRMVLASFGAGYGWPVFFLLAAFLAGLLFALAGNRPLLILAMSYLLGSFVPFFLLLHYSKTQFFYTRYAICFLPIFVIVIAFALTQCLDRLHRWLAPGATHNARRHRIVTVALACTGLLFVHHQPLRATILETNENWRDACRFIQRHAGDNEVLLVQPAWVSYTAPYYGEKLPPIVGLSKSDPAHSLETICQQHDRVWMLTKWGYPKEPLRQAMTSQGFISVCDAYAQGLSLWVFEKALSPETRAQATVSWRRKATSEMRHHPRMDYLVGMAQRAANDEPGALASLETSVAGFRRITRMQSWSGLMSAPIFVNLFGYCVALDALGKTDELRDALETMLALRGDSDFAWDGLSRLEERVSNISLAIAYQENSLQCLKDPSPVAYERLAGLYRRGGRLKEAAQAYVDLFGALGETADENAPQWLVVAAQCLISAGETGQAEDRFQQTIADHPEYVPGYLALAAFYVDKGDLPSAKETVLRGLQKSYQDESLREFATVLGVSTPGDSPSRP